MPRTSVPAVRALVAPAPPKVVLGDEHKKGYSFFHDRWEGEDSHPTAWAVCCYWQQKGWTTNLHEGTDKRWVGGKSIDEVYFKLWLRHPTYHYLYAWWTPTAEEWFNEPKMDELTWFEFVKSDKKK